MVARAMNRRPATLAAYPDTFGVVCRAGIPGGAGRRNRKLTAVDRAWRRCSLIENDYSLYRTRGFTRQGAGDPDRVVGVLSASVPSQLTDRGRRALLVGLTAASTSVLYEF